jgi:hypothetical protein
MISLLFFIGLFIPFATCQSLLASYFQPQNLVPTPNPLCAVSYDVYQFQCSIDLTTYICQYPRFPVYNNNTVIASCIIPPDLYLDANDCVSSLLYPSSSYCPVNNGVSLTPSSSTSGTPTLCTWPYSGTSCTALCYQSSFAQTCRTSPMGCENVVGYYNHNQLCMWLDDDSTVAVPSDQTFQTPSNYAYVNTFSITDVIYRCYWSQSALLNRYIYATTYPSSEPRDAVSSIDTFCDMIGNSSAAGARANALYRAYGTLYFVQSDTNMADAKLLISASTPSYIRCVDGSTYAVNQRYNSNNVLSVACFPCVAQCNAFTEVCSNSGTGCTCTDDSFFNSTIGHCQFYQCPDSNQYGFDCSQICADSALNAVCDSGPNGSGNVSCPSPLVLNAAQSQCTTIHCMLNTTDQSVCNRHGICSGTTNGAFSFCQCDLGWEGQYCQYNNDTALDVCDCGTSIQTAQSLSPGAVLSDANVVIDSPRIQLLQLYTTASNGSVFPTYPPPLRPIGSVAAATYLCWLDVFCTSVITFRLPTSTPYNPAALGPTTPLFVLFLTTSPGSTLTLVPAYNSYSLVTLSRFAGYNCPSPNVDTTFYYQTYRAQIQDYLQSIFSPIVQVTYSTGAAAALHWRYVGSRIRNSPNAQCVLLPLLYTTSSQCVTPTCPVVGTPCSSHGYCTSSTALSYGNTTFSGTCVCNSFASSDISVQGLGNSPAWSGIACQYTNLLCLAPGATALCSGYTTACQPRAIWNPSISVFSINNTDFVPQCTCTGLPVTGQYCQTSQCGSDGLQNSNGCNLVGACLLNTTSGAYFCQCPADRVGVHCEIAVPQCANYATSPPLQCSNQGVCLLNVTYACQCNVNFSGTTCQNSQCAPTVMTPGHGNCVNGILSGCFAVYSGSRCQNDQCTLYGGIVTNGGGSCDCSSSHLVASGIDSWDINSGFNTTNDTVPFNINNATTWTNVLNGVVTSTCWPSCPYLNGALCGVNGSTCLQVQGSGTTRTAICNCPLAFILNTTTNTCQAWCSNGGTIDNNWTAQRPTPCLCPNTPYISGNPAFPNCNTLICIAGQGVYNNITQSCACFPPYSGSNCNTLPTSCPNVVPWLQNDDDNALNAAIEPISPFRCSCTSPRTYSNPSTPFDCLGNQCTPNGIFFASTNSCVCLGQWRTLASDRLPCQSTFCLNGGFPNSTNPSICSCVFPFTNGPLGVCENTACVNSTTVSIEADYGCICANNYTGPMCEFNEITDLYVGESLPTSSSESSLWSSGIIAGIVIGGVVALIIILGVATWTYRSRSQDDQSYRVIHSLVSSMSKPQLAIKKYT